MSPKELATYVRNKTRTDSTTFTDSELLSYLNARKDDLASEIIKRNEDFFGMPFTTNLVADQREYPLPDEILQVKFVEAKLDGDGWRHLRQFDLNSFPQGGGNTSDPLDMGTLTPDSMIGTSEQQILDLFTDSRPMFEKFRQSLWLYSGSAIVDVEGGLKLHGIIYPANITDLTSEVDMAVPPSTTSHGTPRQFHRVLAIEVIVDYKNSQDNPIPLTDEEANVEAMKMSKLDSISEGDLDRIVEAQQPYTDGSNF